MIIILNDDKGVFPMNKLDRVVEGLKYRKIDVTVFETKELVKKALLDEINNDETIGIGGSMTIEQLNIYDDFVARGNLVHWHWKSDQPMAVIQAANVAEYYLSSCNGITEDGVMINIDGFGNRVAALSYGPKKVRVIIGVNKISGDFDETMNRIKTIACPQNARRLNKKTPCAVQDVCSDCKSPDRICSVTSIIERTPSAVELKVYIVNESLGY